MSRFNSENLSSGGGKTFEQPTPGVQEARILRVIELGKRAPHPKYAFNDDGSPKAPKTKFMFMFELAEDKVTVDGKELPMLAFYQMNEAGRKQNGEHSKFTKIVEAAGVSGDFELTDFIGKPVSLTLTKDPKGDYVNVTDVSALPAKYAENVPELVADAYALDFLNPDPVVVTEKLSNKMINKLKEAVNFPGSKVEAILSTVVKAEETKPSGVTGME